MFRDVFETDNTTGFLFLRLSLGAVMLAHGAQSGLGLFGGAGYEKTIAALAAQIHLPAPVATAVLLAELLGAVGLIFGFLTRIAALGITVAVTVCGVMQHLQYGFFMNWLGRQGGEGYEYHLLVLGMGIALMIKGAGALSIDRLLSRGE